MPSTPLCDAVDAHGFVLTRPSPVCVASPGNGSIDASEMRSLMEELGHSECSEVMISGADRRDSSCGRVCPVRARPSSSSLCLRTVAAVAAVAAAQCLPPPSLPAALRRAAFVCACVSAEPFLRCLVRACAHSLAGVTRRSAARTFGYERGRQSDVPRIPVMVSIRPHARSAVLACLSRFGGLPTPGRSPTTQTELCPHSCVVPLLAPLPCRYVERQALVERNINKVFAAIDTNGDGHISAEGARAVLVRLNPLQMDNEQRIDDAVGGLMQRKHKMGGGGSKGGRKLVRRQSSSRKVGGGSPSRPHGKQMPASEGACGAEADAAAVACGALGGAGGMGCGTAADRAEEAAIKQQPKTAHATHGSHGSPTRVGPRPMTGRGGGRGGRLPPRPLTGRGGGRGGRSPPPSPPPSPGDGADVAQVAATITKEEFKEW